MLRYVTDFSKDFFTEYKITEKYKEKILSCFVDLYNLDFEVNDFDALIKSLPFNFKKLSSEKIFNVLTSLVSAHKETLYAKSLLVVWQRFRKECEATKTDKSDGPYYLAKKFICNNGNDNLLVVRCSNNVYVFNRDSIS